MSISTQISRLQNIKAAIRTALVNKGIAASNHNMEDFATDIANISTGTDVSDTTATASSVVSGKYFYLADGTKTEGTIPLGQDMGTTTLVPDTTAVRKNYPRGYYSDHSVLIEAVNGVAPGTSGTRILANTLFKATKDGYVINGYSSVVPNADGVFFGSGFVNMSSSGYAYSEKPSGNLINVSREEADTITTLSQIPVDAKYVIANLWLGTYRWFHFMASLTDSTVIFYWRTSSSNQSAAKIGYRNSTAIGNTNPLNIKTIDGEEVWQLWTPYNGDYEIAWG